MLDKKGFDMWANGYDKSVGLSEEENTYPFAGYKKVLNFIYKKILSGKKANPKILDIGFGTGTLTKKLYDSGCDITGVDFSDEMIKLAKNKMPNAKLYEADFSHGLPKEICDEKFDFIVATYSLHHLTDEDKVNFLRKMLNNLTDSGIIFIGDVAFKTRRQLDKCKAISGENWDEDEIYFVYDEIKTIFKKIKFHRMSHCSAVISIKRNVK